MRLMSEPGNKSRIFERSKIMSLKEIASCVVDLKTLRKDWSYITNAIGNAKVVMIGESTHGTENFYELRAALTKDLLINHGFNFVAVSSQLKISSVPFLCYFNCTAMYSESASR